MSEQRIPQSMQNITIQFEVLPEDEQTADIADTNEVGQSLIDQLRSQGYTVNPSSAEANRGKKGGPLFDLLVQVPQFIHDNRDLLLSMFDSVSLALQFLLIARERRAEVEKAHREPIEFTLEVDGQPVTIKVHDADSGLKLLESFQAAHPKGAQKVNQQSSMKIKVKVPRKKRHHSHG